MYYYIIYNDRTWIAITKDKDNFLEWLKNDVRDGYGIIKIDNLKELIPNNEYNPIYWYQNIKKLNANFSTIS